MLRIENIKIYEDLNEDELMNKVLNLYNIAKNDVKNFFIRKKAIDARDKKNVHYVYIVEIDVLNEMKYPNLKKVATKKEEAIIKRRNSNYRPIIVGSGPAGLFCALMLVDNGYKPIIIEQGKAIEKRVDDVLRYKKNGEVNELSNVQFGEGGAGTFSDGKLTTGIKSPYIEKVLNYFFKFGAPKEILYLSKPHIGTDNLVRIIQNMRKYIEEKGGTYFFETKFTDIKKDKQILKIKCNEKIFETDALVLAIGHSARDTYRMLVDKGLEFKRKNFAIGVRIEHKQKMIDEAQYGLITKLKLPPAEYKLAYHNGKRSCYTFCMCPGGEVIASASNKKAIVTNGMSNYKRDGENANSALLVNVMATDFAGDDPLAGVYFQEDLEHKAYILGGQNGNAPIQRVDDFLNNRKSVNIGNVIPSYKPGFTLCNLNDILPSFISQTLKEGIVYFNRKLKGFADSEAILTGVETRSSSPVTIVRNDELMSNFYGIYPCGEGAGFAGGITSAAVDGIKVAIKIIEKI